MLLVPYSSIIAMMLWRMPVRIEATTIAAVTPITIPSTVRKLRNLLARTLSSAITSVSRGRILGSLILIRFLPQSHEVHEENQIKLWDRTHETWLHQPIEFPSLCPLCICG